MDNRLSRRGFVALGAGALLASALPAYVVEGDSPPRTRINPKLKRKPLEILRHRIAVGAREPFKAMHVTDSHLTLCNARENDPRKVDLAMRRSVPWRSNWHYLEAAVQHARAHEELLLHTGDLMDFVSIANLDAAGTLFQEDDWFVCAGNHEYSKYVGEAHEDEKYKRDSYDIVQRAYPNDLTLASRIVNGVNFVALDDVYLYIPEAGVKGFAKEVEKGLPIVVMCHVPLYSPELHEVYWKARGHLLGITGVPMDVVADPKTGRKGNGGAAAADFVRYLRSEKLVKAVLSGHVHRPYTARFSPTAIQYTGGCGAEGVVNELEFV